MKSLFPNLIAHFAIFLVVLIPVAAFAQSLNNPLDASINTLPKFVSALLKSVVTFSLPIVGIYIIYSGFLFVTAQGNQEKLSIAKENFIWVILGSSLVLGAWMLTEIVASTASELTGSKEPNNAVRSFKGQ